MSSSGNRFFESVAAAVSLRRPAASVAGAVAAPAPAATIPDPVEATFYLGASPLNALAVDVNGFRTRTLAGAEWVEQLVSVMMRQMDQPRPHDARIHDRSTRIVFDPNRRALTAPFGQHLVRLIIVIESRSDANDVVACLYDAAIRAGLVERSLIEDTCIRYGDHCSLTVQPMISVDEDAAFDASQVISDQSFSGQSFSGYAVHSAA